MRGLSNARFFPLLAASVLVATWAAAGQVVSTPKNVKAVMEARGFYLAPTQASFDASSPAGIDLAPIQSFEIVRPNGERVTIGRLFTSCTCVQLESSKRTFERGERAVLNLHNVLATPPGGQNYALYVQITNPIRTTLRIDTFVQSSQFIPSEPIPAAGGEASRGLAEPESVAPEIAGDNGETAQSPGAEQPAPDSGVEKAGAEEEGNAEEAEAEAAAAAVEAAEARADSKAREAVIAHEGDPAEK